MNNDELKDLYSAIPNNDQLAIDSSGKLVTISAADNNISTGTLIGSNLSTTLSSSIWNQSNIYVPQGQYATCGYSSVIEDNLKKDVEVDEIIEKIFDKYGFKVTYNNPFDGGQEKRDDFIKGCIVLGTYEFPNDSLWYAQSAVRYKNLELEASEDMYFEKFMVRIVMSGLIGYPLILAKDLPKVYSDEEDSKEILDNITKSLNEIVLDISKQIEETSPGYGYNGYISNYDSDTTLTIGNSGISTAITSALGAQGTTAVSYSYHNP